MKMGQLLPYTILAIAVLGNLIAFKFKGIYHKIISIGLTISVLFVEAFSWTDSTFLPYLMTGGIIVILMTIATIIFGLTAKKLSNLERISVTTMGIFTFVSLMFGLLHLPFDGQIRLSMIIPIVITLITFIRGRKLTKEMGFMIFWLYCAILYWLSYVISNY